MAADLRRVVLSPHAPVVAFALVVFAFAPLSCVAIESRGTALLATTAEADQPAVRQLLWIAEGGIATLGMLALGVAIAAIVLAVRSMRRIERRVRRVNDIARTVLTGDMLLLDDEDEVIDDSIGKLESDLRSIAGALAERDAALQEEAFRQRFDGTIQRAMTMAETEEEVCALTTRAIAKAIPQRASELLVTAVGETGLHLATASSDRPCCPVASAGECHAVRRGQTTVFTDAESLDACPRLRTRERPAEAALCIPVPVMGKAVGVLHATTATSRPFSDGEVAGLESLVRHFGARIGMIRALESTKLQAETDALTGLLNRRSLAARCTSVFTDAMPCAIAVCDLDHFKLLNDTHGHDAGDRALRLFAQVVRQCVRPTDVVGRYGGEEFVIVLPGASAEQAVAVLERVREALQRATENAGPRFTCSFGVSAYPSHGATLEDLVQSADRGLYRAKENGRDRIEVATAAGGLRPAA